MVGSGARVGVLGGMGPAATSLFYRELVAHTAASCDQEHIDAVILSHATLPDRTRPGVSARSLVSQLADDIVLLRDAGADFVAIPCNTAHVHYDALSALSSLPIIDMVDAAVLRVLEFDPAACTVGVLCTDGTRADGLYTRACLRHGLEVVYPAPERQKAVMELVYGYVKRGKDGGEGLFEAAYCDVKGQGGDAVVLGCTELSVYRTLHRLPNDCVDALDALVRATVARSGKRYRA